MKLVHYAGPMRAAQSDSGGTTFRFRHSEALLRSVLENAAVATFLIGPKAHLLYANRAFYELLGYGQGEPVSVAIDDLIHPDDIDRARAQMETLDGGSTDNYRGERRYLRKDGSPIWVLVSASALRDEKTGEPAYTIVQASNIDRQKRAEAALAESESRWNFALESAGQGVWDINLNAGTAFYSRMWRLMRGIGPDEEVDPSQEKWLARMHPDDRERIRQIADRQDAGILKYNEFEYREQHRDGRWIWILSRGKPVSWNPDGTPARMLGTDTDISNLKLVEAQLALEKERLKVTLESIADAVISTDAGGRITFMNPAAEQMTDWPQERAVGRPVEEIFNVIDGQTGAPTASPVAECLAKGRMHYVDGDAVLVRRKGDHRDVRTSAAPVRTPQGLVIGVVLVFQDVTSSRALQRKLAHTAMHDSLTGLPNRATFERALDEAVEQARSDKREYSLCFVDLDRFKFVNDNAGHGAGDMLLQKIAGAIRSSCRAHDLAARIGGDEFALLLPDCPIEAGIVVAQKVVDAISAIRFESGGTTYEIGASVGVTGISSRCRDAAEVMNQADAACYVAKARGRNCVSVYDGRRSGLAQLQNTA